MSQDLANIERKVKSAVAEQLDIEADEIRNDAAFIADLGADSLDLAELLMTFESDFDITIAEEDSKSITTVQSAIDYIAAKLA